MDIEVGVDGPVMALKLNRPGKKNAITAAMYGALADALERAASDPAIRVVTISGDGGCFTAGNDLNDFLANPPRGPDEPVFRFLRAIASFSKILVAGVAGPAVGVGTTMLLHCDLVFAAPDAIFSLPFVDLGLVPEAASSLLLPALIGRQRAAKHFILGDPFDAETALAYGLVTAIVAQDGIETALHDAALRIAAKPPEAVRMTKQLLTAPPTTVAQRMATEGEMFADRLSSPEAMQAFRSFFETRNPESTPR